MAQMTPLTVPAKATPGEQALFRILVGLPEDVVVYYDIQVKHRHPDFVVVSPRLGILTIEIKDWKTTTIISANNDIVELRLRLHSKRVMHPVKQAREYALALKSELESRADGYILLQKDGPYKGNACFPISHLAILSQISRRDIERLNLTNVFDSARTLTEDWLRLMQNVRGQALEESLEPYFRPKFQFMPLNKAQMNKLRAIIYPDTVILDSIRPIVTHAVNTSRSWGVLAEKLAVHGLEYFERGGGLAVRSIPSGRIICKASQVGPGYSELMRKLQCPFPGHAHTWLAEKALSIKH